ncbi:S8 family peptidase [Flavobacterium silvaticum]|uniref:S8 family serine peptidase n=1 Tax=Flavobacterium silvaticum TaxID=1852020 RepID=A0A972G0Z8_9FLAO|nr:S8 family peptidase [Flavobacterium silvaticum]NMH28446.1 S8 family serine peptidase [Flavobacterium silvaticum]
MKKFYSPITLSAVAFAFFIGADATAQVSAKNVTAKKKPLSETDLKRWSDLDLEKDSVPGMSVDRAYEFLKGKKGKTVIVAVVDSGVDIEHEDLQGRIWTNKKEIAGNGKDDDNNGYVDDVNGWNFLGNTVNETLEITRMIKKNDTKAPGYAKMKADYDEQYKEATESLKVIAKILEADATIRKETATENYTADELKALKSNDSTVNAMKPRILNFLNRMSKPEFDKYIQAGKKRYESQVSYNLNVDFDGRKSATGDDPENINAKFYGDNHVYGPDKEDASHGTHCAGIITQIRGNGKGGDGVAENVEIMSVRAVPNGDEYDKDVALAIRYAVDNGAKVINGSFGKSYSPHPEWVFDAIKYAASKDVLIVHAAGNDGHDIDLEDNKNWPNDSEKQATEISDNLITIAALNNTFNESMVAAFSNYGADNVDLFSPGSKIYATIPDNKYDFKQGTSMAAPNVAGVAALIRSYYPSLTASQVKQILMNSGVATDMTLTFGNKHEKRKLAEACRSGKIVNAYNALVMAEKMAKK